MHYTRIKICGIRRVEDARAAAHAGADAIGLVFHEPAARYVAPGQARAILDALPPFVTPVGLFVDSTPQHVRDIARSLGLRHVQLHGHEDPACVAALHDLVVLKAIRVDPATFRKDLVAWRAANARHALTNLRGIVLETAAALPGGTGMANDWSLIRACQTEGLFDGLPPLIAAGGLTPDNVAAVVHDLNPWAVDVSSGVEMSKGIKSPEKIAAFVRAARSVAV